VAETKKTTAKRTVSQEKKPRAKSPQAENSQTKRPRTVSSQCPQKQKKTGPKVQEPKVCKPKTRRLKVRKPKSRKSRDLWHTLALTSMLIGISGLISVAVFTLKGGKVSQDSPLSELAAEMLTLEATPLQAIPPQTVAQEQRPAQTPPLKTAPLSAPPQVQQSVTVTKPQEKQAPAAVAAAPQPKIPVEKAPATPANKPAVKQQPAAPVPQTTVEKAPINKPQNQQPERTSAPKPQTANPQTVGSRIAPAAPPQQPPKPVYQGTLAFVIDDAGNNLQELEPFLRFPGPLTIAVLPGLPHSAEAARRIRAAGKEVFLHQPMEAVGGQNPGPGAIYAEMNAAEIVAVLKQNLAEIGPVVGMNNHQGSKITADQAAMETVLGFCRDRGIYFLDSRTTAQTTAPVAARNLGIPIGERNIFIDNEQNRPSMNRFIEAGLTHASQKGSAVMIGHTWSPELAPLLAELHQDFIDRGYTLTTASRLIK